MTEPRPTSEQAMFDLTGFDEVAIARSFKRPLGDLRAEPFQMLRALAFVQARRDGMKDSEAYTYAMGLTIREVSDLYADPAPATADDEGKEQ